MSQWLRPVTRWGIYLRDGLTCLYCGVTVAELVSDRGSNFLTLDHLQARSKGGASDPRNVMAACYECNLCKARGTVTQFCRDFGHNQHTVKSRIERRRAKDLASYREAAKILLAQSPGLPGLRVADMVLDHDMLVRKQWGESIDASYWEHLKSREHLFCSECGKPRDAEQSDYVPEPEWRGVGGAWSRPEPRYDWDETPFVPPF